MNKMMISAAVVVVMGVSVYVGVRVQQKDAMSDIQMANVEALVNGEGGDCNYTNGYRAFTSKGGGAYDCCKIWVNKAPDKGEGTCH